GSGQGGSATVCGCRSALASSWIFLPSLAANVERSWARKTQCRTAARSPQAPSPRTTPILTRRPLKRYGVNHMFTRCGHGFTYSRPRYGGEGRAAAGQRQGAEIPLDSVGERL